MRVPRGRRTTSRPPGKGGMERPKKDVPPFREGERTEKGGHWCAHHRGARVRRVGSTEAGKGGIGNLVAGSDREGRRSRSRTSRSERLQASWTTHPIRQKHKTRRCRAHERPTSCAATRPCPPQGNDTSTSPAIPFFPLWTAKTAVFHGPRRSFQPPSAPLDRSEHRSPMPPFGRRSNLHRSSREKKT